MKYQYRTCGLENVWLCNGFTESNYGGQKTVAIDNIDGLHRAIAKALVEKPAPLSGSEVRFLRVEMDLSQSMLGTLLGVNEQSVAKWEKGQTRKIPEPAERLIRAIVREKVLNKDGGVSELVEMLAEIDREIIETMEFEETGDVWEAKLCAA